MPMKKPVSGRYFLIYVYSYFSISPVLARVTLVRLLSLEAGMKSPAILPAY